ncbi:MAG: DJ-1/PfpI family protein [Chthoniobacterales bacterium]|nr:DJ-1/PfpI family protein [Chthoniobacterales bacterium]
MTGPDNDTRQAPLRVGALVFPGFEVLDLFGPVELLHQTDGRFSIRIVAAQPGEVASAQNVRIVADEGFGDAGEFDILLVPGGIGTRTEVANPVLLDWLRRMEPQARHVASVCTGSALLAKAGLLDGHRATSNKIAFDWVVGQGPSVQWVRRARWVEDGKFFTSSGISAGMDMTLALVERLFGRPVSEEAARRAEYQWNSKSGNDPFAAA